MKKILQFLLATLILPFDPVASKNLLWNISNLFENCEIHIRFVLGHNNTSDDSDLRYFTQIRQRNSFTPFTLKYIAIYTKDETIAKERPMRALRVSRTSVAFLDLNTKNTTHSHSSTLDLLQRNGNPSYLFVHVDSFSEQPFSIYSNYKLVGSASVLILFDIRVTDLIWIPCIACDTMHRAVSIRNKTLILNHIRDYWANLNNNLHGKLLVIKPPLGNWWNPQCGHWMISFHPLDDAEVCAFHILSDKHNYNITFDNGSLVQTGVDRGKAFAAFVLHRLHQDFVVDSYSNKEIDICSVHWTKFRFVVITQYPAKVNTILGIFNPFDEATWLLILISCLIITIMIQFEAEGLHLRGTLCALGRDLFLVNSLLFGQSSEDNIKMFRNRRVAVPVLIVWLIGSTILMDKLYQGSIYSDLTVTYPATVPRTMQGLLESKMRILTTSGYWKDMREHLSMLKDFIIPKFTASTSTSPEMKNFLIKLDSKLEFVPIWSSVVHIRNISSSLPLFSLIKPYNQFLTNNTFAIMDKDVDLNFYITVLQGLGKRLVINSYDEAPFHLNTIIYGKRNFFFPTIYLGFRRLTESGLYRRWEKLVGMRRSLRAMYGVDRRLYSEFAVRLSSEYKEPVVFYDTSPESLEALGYVVAFCTVVIGFGFLAFLWEYDGIQQVRFGAKILRSKVAERAKKFKSKLRES
ncbi:hypothetical protein Fcan01_27699 [Folsomia candida]|uniref:Uncharacterized protein n=1 Tax=Folsomia candida TaxID=158441 RepID=A0A226CW49_FOLCA|nr:hypothetical protein Fcan01_27699 [Folsomia candida]